MNATAKLRITARIEGGRCLGVAIHGADPYAAGALVGRRVGELVQGIPVGCGGSARAQAIAVRAALAAARGEVYPPSIEDERAIACEAAQAHLSRLLLDWPLRFGRQPQRARCAQLQHRLSQVAGAGAAFDIGGVLLDFVARELLSGFFLAMREPASLAEFISATRYGGFVGETLAELIEAGRWTPASDSVAPLLPATSARQWADMFGNAFPEGGVEGTPCRMTGTGALTYETGALARQYRSPLVAALLGYGHRIAARVFAQVVDLSDDASRLRHPLASDMHPCVDAAPLGEGAGLACVETAHGVLLQLLRIDGDIVTDSHVIAPADWNFAPQGAFASEARGWKVEGPEAALARLDWLALSLDPCLPFEVTMEAGGDA